MKIKLLSIFVLLLTSWFSFAQLTVNDPIHLTPKQLVETALVDPSVVPFNIKFNGSPIKATQICDQAGKFITNFNPTNLGLSQGVLLTTGKNEYALSPNNEAFPFNDESSSTFEGDADLAQLSGQTIRKCAVLEFDFVATGLVLNFDFVFASEEYPDYVPATPGGGVNDSFGFFLSGPGITGTYSSPFPGMNSKNIALVPNTNIPISISTVNNGYNNNGNCTNCAYYYNNSNIGFNPNFAAATSLYTVEYDGFTTPLTAKADLECGKTYHIKLALGNASDNLFDSAVFLKNFRIPPTVITDQYGSNAVNACFGSTVTLNAGTFPAGTIFIWKKDGVIQAAFTGPTLTTTDPGNYCVTVLTPLSCQIAQDCITVAFEPKMPIGDPIDVPLCTTTAASYSFNIDQTVTMLGTQSPSDYNFTYFDASQTTVQLVKDGILTGLIPNANLSSYTVTSLTSTIYVRIEDLNGNGCVEVKPFDLKVTIQPTGTFSYSQATYCTAITTSQTVTATVSANGTYSATPAGLNINTISGVINPSLSLPNTYIVEYKILATGSCPQFTTTANVEIIGTPIAPIITNPSFCKNTTPTLGLETYVTGSNLLWYANATGGTGSTTVPPIVTTSTGNSTYFVSQSNGVCEGPRASITVTITPLLTAPIVTITQPTCAVSTGTIAITPIAGTNIEYSINNGLNYQNGVVLYQNLTNTNYVVKYKDAGGCVSEPTPVVFTPALNVPNAPTGRVTFHPNCTTPTGTITIDDTLNPNYSYSKDNGVTFQSRVFQNLSPNTTYTIIVKDGVSGCISQPTTFLINPIPSNPNAPLGNVAQQPTCLDPYGKIKITTPIAGSGFVYSKDGINFQADDEFLNLLPNTSYTISIKDSNTGCISLGTSFFINGITSIPATPTITGLQQPTCAKNTGSFTVISPIGSQYQYSRDNGVSYQSDVLFDFVPANAIYFLKVKDMNTGCVSLANSIPINAALNVPSAPTGSVTFRPNCITPTGTITLDLVLGSNYSYSIDNGVTFQGRVFQNLSPNTTYDFIVKDIVSGCLSSASSIFVNPIPNIPNPPTVIQAVTPTCTTPLGTIEVTQPIGTNFMYKRNGSNYQSDRFFYGLLPNTAYDITVKDIITGCVSNVTTITDPIPANPSPPQGVVTQPTCINPFGKIKITSPVVGAGFQYSKDGANFQNEDEFLNLTPNSTYTIYIRNSVTGCISVGEIFHVDPTILPPAKPIASGSDVCESETIMLNTPTVTGAVYNWTGPNGFVSTDQNPQIPNATVANDGVYKVSISLFADCPSLPGEVVINVNELPQPELNQNEYICTDTTTNTVLKPTLEANLNNTDYHFEWYNIENANAILINNQTQNNYLVETSGVYGVTAINNITGCISEMVTSTVSETSPPKDIKIVTSDYFSDVQTITVNVEPVGDYEYQIDNGVFQSSNVFSYITSGSHTINVKNECDEKSTIASVVNFPRFFTPNGDNYNDRWNIFDLNGQANSKIYIFDRFGKLLKEISPNSQDGWDGTINNVDLPASDYWFSIFYEENGVSKVFKSHFALKR